MKQTNMEHYKGEIEKIMEITADCAPAVVNGKPVACLGTPCSNCDLYKKERPCTSAFIKWLMSEYKPEPVLTQREKSFVEFAQEGWLARDEDGELYLFAAKPQKKACCWNIAGIHVRLKAFGDIFPFITWEDESPWAVEELRKLKVKE